MNPPLLRRREVTDSAEAASMRLDVGHLRPDDLGAPLARDELGFTGRGDRQRDPRTRSASPTRLSSASSA